MKVETNRQSDEARILWTADQASAMREQLRKDFLREVAGPLARQDAEARKGVRIPTTRHR